MYRRMFSAIGYVIFLGIFAVGFRFFHNYFFAILLFFFLLFPVISPLFTRYALQKCSYIIIAPASVTKGGSFTLEIQRNNPTWIPLPRHQLFFQLSHSLYPNEDIHQISAGIPVRSHSSLRIPVTALYSGYLQVQLLRAEALDFLGIFLHKVSLETGSDIAVFPLALETEFDTKSVSGPGVLEIAESNQKGTDSSQQFDVRPYQPGDRLNTIHWKLSVKADELIVREFGSLAGDDACILLDLYPTAVPKAAPSLLERLLPSEQSLICKNAGFDLRFDLLHTLASRLLSEKRPFLLCFFSKKSQTLMNFEITEAQELFQCYRRLFYETPCPSETETLDSFLKIDEIHSEFFYIHSSKTIPQSIESTHLFGAEDAVVSVLRRSL